MQLYSFVKIKNKVNFYKVIKVVYEIKHKTCIGNDNWIYSAINLKYIDISKKYLQNPEKHLPYKQCLLHNWWIKFSCVSFK